MMYWVEFSIQDLCLSSCVEVSHQPYIEGTCVWSCSLWTFGKATPGLHLGLCFAVCVCCLEEVRKKDAPETLDGQAAASNILKHDMQCMRIMLVRLLEDTRHKRHKRHPYKVLHIFEHSATPRFYATRFFLVGSKIGSFRFCAALWVIRWRHCWPKNVSSWLWNICWRKVPQLFTKLVRGSFNRHIGICHLQFDIASNCQTVQVHCWGKEARQLVTGPVPCASPLYVPGLHWARSTFVTVGNLQPQVAAT